MKRIIIAGTIAFLAAITVGTTFVHDPLLQAFIASDLLSQTVRLVLIGLLTVLFFTAPPRSIEFRTALGFASGLLSIGVAIMMSQYSIALLDALLFVEVAIIFALEALESPITAKTSNKKIAI